MGIVSGIVVFLLVWWTVLFMVLPMGATPPEDIGEGHEPGAPARPQLLKKFIITTGISVIVFLAIWFLVSSRFVSFHDMVAEWE